MKKLVAFSIVCILGLFSCINPPVAKDYSCKEFSADCELEKDYMLVLPVLFDKKTIDAYGNQITGQENNQWYMIPRKTHLMIPTYFKVCTGYEKTGDSYSPVYTDHPTVAEINNCKDEYKGKIKADSINLSLIIPGLTKAIVIATGPNELLLNKGSFEIAFAKEK